MRVLVTGASGFLGAHVVARLVAHGGHAVAVVLRQPGTAWRIQRLLHRVTVIAGSLDGLDAVRPAVRAFAPDTVIHAAWAGVGSKHRNDRTQLTNVGHTIDLVELAREVGVRHFVGIGSQAEYGPSEGPLSEDAPTRPTTLYGVAKLAAGLAGGQLCRDAGVRFAWLRLFSAYGPADDPAWMLPALVLRLLAGGRPLLTEGTQIWDYLYVEDAARAVDLVARTAAAVGVFNLGSGRPETVRRIAEHVRDEIDPTRSLGFGDVPFRPDQIMHLEADVRRLRDATGWSPEVDLGDGVRRTVAWFREHGARYDA